MSKKVNKVIFKDNLPRKIYHGKDCIDWTNSKGFSVKFIYGELTGSILVKDTRKGKNNTELLLSYNNKEKWCDSGKMNDCSIGALIGTYNHDYIYEIGQTFKDNKRDFTIIDKKTEKDKGGISRKYYKYHCNKEKCGAELWMQESNIKRGSECSCCCKSSNKSVVKGINDMATTNPELVKYFVNIEDTYKYSNYSNKTVKLICPNCGTKRDMKICSLYVNGFSCSMCGDGISYPEKVMGNLLKQLKIDFKTQLSKTTYKWCDKYRYDFYFNLNDEEYIIETHGRQHYEQTSNTFKCLEEQQNIDKCKEELALNNGINNYIIVDCRTSNIDFIRENIIHSKLNNIFDLSAIDWNDVEKESQKSAMIEVCKYWKEHNNINNEELSTTYVGDMFDISRTTVLEYIKNGDKLGLCDYKKRNKILKTDSDYVEVYKDKVKLGEFNTYKEIIEKLSSYNLNCGKISKACKNKTKYKGLDFIIKSKSLKEAI